MVVELRGLLEPLGFLVEADGPDVRITDPQNKTQTFDLEDAYYLFRGLKYQPMEAK